MNSGPAVTPPLSGLAALLAASAGAKVLPLPSWNPPYCGDIGLAIASDGTWSYRGSPIERKPLAKLFSRVLIRESDGRHYLVTPAEKVDVKVADAAFLAVELEVEGAGAARRLLLRTNLDDVVAVGPDHPLTFAVDPSGGLVPYVLVRNGLTARLTRSVQFELMDLVEEDAAGRPYIASGGARFSLPA